MKIRVANIKDAKEILDIYEYFIINSNYSFEYETPDFFEFSKRIEKTLPNFPYLVCEIDGKIVGYAYAGAHGTRLGYQYNALLTVYVDNNYTGKKIGVKLYKALFDILKEQNYVNLYALIESSNVNSIGMHEYLGFKSMAFFEKTGFKRGEWVDLVWSHKVLNPHLNPPKDIIAFKDLTNVSQILQKFD